MPLLPGTKLGPYEITSPIGKGGMGEVYRARDTKLGRDVAIKVLPDELASDDQRVARFEREAKLRASLNHPNIAAIYGFQQNALVLELVEGPTLADRIAEGSIPVEEVIAIAKQVADALEAGHEAGVIHRDLKPANVKIKDDGTVKVLDYGLAKALEGDATSGASADSQLSQSPTLTREGTQIGVILGTAAYMSPEQAKGKRVDRRADIWAFGAVLFEMLTGKRAFEGEDVSETLAAVLRGEPDWALLPAKTPRALSRLMKRCLTRDLRRRLPAIGEARIQLEDLAADPWAGDASEATPRRFRQVALPWALAALFGLVLLFQLRRPTESRPVTRLDLRVPASGSFSGTNRGPRVALSPDGRTMAFVGGSPVKLLVRGMDQSSWTELTGTEGAVSPFFSPDGEWIGFFADNSLKKVPTRGGTTVTLCEARCTACEGSWGERDTILFNNGGGLVRVPANGGSCELVAEATGGIFSPDWLPGERAALVTTRGENGPRVELLRSPGGERTVIQEGAFRGRHVPSGHLVYVQGNDLYAVPFDPESFSKKGAAVVTVRVVHASVDIGTAQFNSSRAGSLVYLAGPVSQPRSSLAWVERDGTASAIALAANFYNQPRLSPDGTRVALMVNDPSEGPNIWLVDPKGGVASRLTFGGKNNFSPLWSPDSQYVAFSSVRNGVFAPTANARTGSVTRRESAAILWLATRRRGRLTDGIS